MIAKILVNTSVKTLNKVYDYIVPDELANDVEIGKRVEISFGVGIRDSNEGIIVKLVNDADITEKPKYKLKSIISVLDEVSYVNESRLKLAKYISHLYFCNVYDALKLMLPPGTKSKLSSKSLKTKQETIVKLLKTNQEIIYDIENENITSPKHIRLLNFLLENEVVYINDIIEGLDISRAVVKTVEKNGYIGLEKIDPPKDFLEDLNLEKTSAKEPTDEQREAILKITESIRKEEYNQTLLFGVTGSGKTEVYLQVLEEVLKKGKRAVVLVPEISLTYQTLTRFVSRFGNNVAVLHSKMTVSKRKEEYKRIKRGEVDIVVGARSAIFSPLENIGIVIIDEEHDTSYYSNSTPKYSTKTVAEYICRENGATLLLGSATPEISTYYKALNTSAIDLVKLTKRPSNAVLPKVELVDIKEDKILGNTSLITMRLKEEIAKNIQKGEQTMIFLNRRGYVSYLSCKECSTVLKCPNCDISLTYHKNNKLLLCHYCSYVQKNIQKCEKCGSESVSSLVQGTQKIEEELKQIYPDITTIRMDADTTMARDSHQKILDEFKEKKINVLIGTQMISKGHDISNVTLVGILGVDSMLAMNDYLASEKAFSNISQVAGRAGRGDIPGKVIIQTAISDSYILDAVEKHNYEEFYEKEIEHREVFKYPPFTDILLFELIGKNAYDVKKEANVIYEILNKEAENMYKVYSPKTPYIQKLNNRYRVNILMKTKLTTQVYKKIYDKINEYNKTRKKDINMTITINPSFIG